jgi:hypothetical protein
VDLRIEIGVTKQSRPMIVGFLVKHRRFAGSGIAGGLILAHNVGTSGEYDRAVTTNPALETVFFTQGGGLGITLKKR